MKAVGIDGGGSGTRFVLLDEERGLLKTYTASIPSNYHLVGVKKLEKVLKKGIGQVSKDGEFDVLGAGLSGVDREEDIKIVSEILSSLKVKRFSVSNDAIAALWGALNGEGILMIAGTGSIIIGRNKKGEIARAGGWGYLLEEYCSGYWFANKAAVATLKMVDGTGKFTSLSGRIKDFYSLRDERQLVYIYYSNFDKSKIAAAAPIVFEEAELGDEVANGIVKTGIENALEMIYAVKRRCGFGKYFEFSYGGRVFSSSFFIKRFREVFSREFPSASFTKPRFDAATGAAVMALEDARRGKI